MVAKYGLKAVQKLSANPESMQQMQAAAAGFRAVGSKFRVPNLKNMPFMRGAGASGFEPTMTRREAAQILGIRCVGRVFFVAMRERRLGAKRSPLSGVRACAQ